MELCVTDPDDKARLKQLEERIEAVKETQAPKAHSDEPHTQAQLAWRMVIELVTGMIIGFGIGYGLDSLFGTTPIFMVLFILLGFAAGVNVMIRSAKEIQEKKLAEPQDADADRDERD